MGTVLISNPLHIIKKIAAGIGGVFGSSKFSKQVYVDALKTMYDLLNRARKDGLMALEADVEEPDKSPVFSKNPTFLKNHHVRDFVCDSLRMAITGFDAFELDQMLDLDMEVHHHDSTQPTTALSTMADSLPGLGIVAAVLGVVITIGALGGPPEEIGHKVAAALVGTFLGILLCYGLVGPIAANMTKAAEEEHAFLLRHACADRFFLEGHCPWALPFISANLRTADCGSILRMDAAKLSEAGATQEFLVSSNETSGPARHGSVPLYRLRPHVRHISSAPLNC